MPTHVTTDNAGVSPADELGVGALFLLRAPERASDFADMAWIVSQALGDGTGVIELATSVDPDDGRMFVHVRASSARYVYGVAARVGLHAWERDGFACAVGDLGPVHVCVSWRSRDRDGAHSSPSSAREGVA